MNRRTLNVDAATAATQGTPTPYADRVFRHPMFGRHLEKDCEPHLGRAPRAPDRLNGANLTFIWNWGLFTLYFIDEFG